MIKVVFVGELPSRTNIAKDIAFVGAMCFPRLVEWINYLKPDYYICLNSDSSDDMVKIKKLKQIGFKVVALGNVSHKRIKDQLRFDAYKMDHPSGLNRKLNNEIYVRGMLNQCKLHLQEVV